MQYKNKGINEANLYFVPQLYETTYVTFWMYNVYEGSFQSTALHTNNFLTVKNNCHFNLKII